MDCRFLTLIIFAIMLLSCNAEAKLNPFAKSIQIDPNFSYYMDRSPESIALEIKANGFSAVRLIVTNDNNVNPKLIEEFHKAGIAVWYETWGNGTYAFASLPPGSEKWQMKLKSKKANEAAAGFVYLCMNNPEYRKWKKEQVVKTLKHIPFDGFEIAETFWPAVNGPESDYYGCLCDHCKAAFLKMYPEEKSIPDFFDKKSPNYYKTNSNLYKKWVSFRCQSIASFQDFIINSPGGVRNTRPNIKVAAWGIADDIPNPVETLREWEGSDGPLIVTTVRPDIYVIQTDWPDWSNPNLPADYPLKYKPFVDAVRKVSGVPIIMQTDVGSKEMCRRGYEWMHKCEASAKEAGMLGITAYEYHLNLDIYKLEPRPLYAIGKKNLITIVFNKRLDPKKASCIENFVVTPCKINDIEVDGNIVHLKVKGKPNVVAVRNLADDYSKRFFKNYPAVAMSAEVKIPVKWQEK
ncbi:MAG: hypothetical protein K6T99_06545 [Armatimonadetes bacterium]|nr:hypothetical protein [Armatimonadota bacterium]